MKTYFISERLYTGKSLSSIEKQFNEFIKKNKVAFGDILQFKMVNMSKTQIHIYNVKYDNEFKFLGFSINN